MTTTAADRRRGLIDRRLAARVTATRRFLVGAVAVGLLATVSVVAQAVLLASVVSAALLHGAGLGTLWPRLVWLAIAFGVRAGCAWAGEAAAHRTAATVTSTLRRQLLHHTLALGPGWLSGERSGEISLSATRGIAALTVFFGRYLPQAVLAGIAPVAILAWVGYEDWPSMLILAALVGLVPVAMVYFGRESAARTRRQWRRLSSLSSRFLELVRGLPTLRAFGRQARGRREVFEATDALRATTIDTLRVAFLSALAMEFVAGIGTGLVAMVLGLRLLGGSVSLYSALAVLLVSPEVFLPLRRAGAEFHASTEGQAAAERILSVLDVPLEGQGAAERGGPGRGTGGPARAMGAEWPACAPLRMTGVSVAFPGRIGPVVADLDLEVGDGEHVALVGPSGSGKSTVLSLLLGFARPTAGTITLGGIDLRALDIDDWRRLVAWVPQRPHLVHGSIADNLALAAPDASPGRLAEVVALVELDHLVDALPEGLATPVGDAGVTLSAGERQRLALARAVLRDAPVVLLDEPVAHLDARAEARLAASLGPWLADRTVVIAAHRPELVARIDRVVSLTPAPAEPVAAGDVVPVERWDAGEDGRWDSDMEPAANAHDPEAAPR